MHKSQVELFSISLHLKASDLVSVEMHICYEYNLVQYAYTRINIDEHHIIISLVVNWLVGPCKKLLAEVFGDSHFVHA